MWGSGGETGPTPGMLAALFRVVLVVVVVVVVKKAFPISCCEKHLLFADSVCLSIPYALVWFGLYQVILRG